MSPTAPQNQLEARLSAVVLAVTDDVLRILTVDHQVEEGVLPGLPFGPLDVVSDRTLELGLRGWVRRLTGLQLGYVEQLYTFGDRDRLDPGSQRVLSIAYVALVREADLDAGSTARWRDCYEYFPWENWRAGRPFVLEAIESDLDEWAASVPALAQVRRERVAISFGFGGGVWDEERVLDRYELLWEAGLVAESSAAGASDQARIMAFDHRRVLATALGRVRGKLQYRPVVFELLPPKFTLLALQRVVETLAGVRLHKQNFRRLVENNRLVEPTGLFDRQTGGRPAELFSFRRAVLLERPAPGVGLPQSTRPM